MKSALIAFLMVSSSSAFALDARTFECSNSAPGLPKNVYKIDNFNAGGKSLSTAEFTRYYRAKPSDPNSEIVESKLAGPVTVSTTGNRQIVMLGALRIELVDGEMSGCKP